VTFYILGAVAVAWAATFVVAWSMVRAGHVEDQMRLRLHDENWRRR
jgi:hypothetical protein